MEIKPIRNKPAIGIRDAMESLISTGNYIVKDKSVDFSDEQKKTKGGSKKKAQTASSSRAQKIVGSIKERIPKTKFELEQEDDSDEDDLEEYSVLGGQENKADQLEEYALAQETPFPYHRPTNTRNLQAQSVQQQLQNTPMPVGKRAYQAAQPQLPREVQYPPVGALAPPDELADDLQEELNQNPVAQKKRNHTNLESKPRSRKVKIDEQKLDRLNQVQKPKKISLWTGYCKIVPEMYPKIKELAKGKVYVISKMLKGENYQNFKNVYEQVHGKEVDYDKIRHVLEEYEDELEFKLPKDMDF
jgi:hypothetical protein